MMGWKQSLKEVFRCPKDLLRHLNVDLATLALDITPEFRLRVPKEFVDLMEKGNPTDPLLLQVLSSQEELQSYDGFVKDPLDESSFQPIPGVIHKYKNRVLWVLSGGCAIHCRYCFRRHFPYSHHQWDKNQWKNALNYLVDHPEINEVILSGGDPLMLSDVEIQGVFDRLSLISSVKTIRIHTRLPVVIPKRLTPLLCRIFDNCNTKLVIVFHINHPNEIGDELVSSLQSLPSHVVKLNQSVLLKGINDDANVLAHLSMKLFQQAIMPYYLHQLDPVQGAAHFEVPLARAQCIYRELAAAVSGYLLPRWVQELPNQPNKTQITLE
ncbi:MAG TPA: EF-P beta-lysylation protein EpmB [Gammaproteobacteria bacterium]|nr:EF-P beta-lysylation protein EpmB [Gammaproteobacteria bacterium]